MVKCEVLDNCVIAVGKGSIVNVSERQFELARKKLKPVTLEKEKKSEEKVEKIEEVKVETAELPKAKQTRKKK